MQDGPEQVTGAPRLTRRAGRDMRKSLATFFGLIALSRPGRAAADPRPAFVLDPGGGTILFANAGLAALSSTGDLLSILEGRDGQASALAAALLPQGRGFLAGATTGGLVRLPGAGGPTTTRFEMAAVRFAPASAGPAAGAAPRELVLVTLTEGPALDDDPLKALERLLAAAVPVRLGTTAGDIAEEDDEVPGSGPPWRVGGMPGIHFVEAGPAAAPPPPRPGPAQTLLQTVRAAFERRHGTVDPGPATAEGTVAVIVDPDQGAMPENASPEAVPALSKPEEDAFRAIASALGARFEGDLQDAPGAGPDEPPPADAIDDMPGPAAPAPWPGPPPGWSAAVGVFEAVPMPLLLVRDGAILAANPAATRLFGLAGPAAMEAAGGLSALVGGPLPVTDDGERPVALQLSNGTMRPARARLVTTVHEGAPAVLLALAVAEPAPARPGPPERALAAAGAFAEGLRLPLSSMAGMAEVLRNGGAALARGRAQDYAEALRTEAVRLLLSVDDLAAYARLRLAGPPPAGGFADLRPLLEEAVETHRETARAADAVVSLAMAETPARVPDDADLVAMLLSRLIAGAIGRARGGGRVWVDLSPSDGDDALLTVRDDGPGLDRDALSKALDPFGLDTAGEPAPGHAVGQGPASLDLALAAVAARHLGLPLTVRSTVETGTTAEVRLRSARP